MPGGNSFDGDVWHIVDRPVKYDFSNKRIAFVGTGPTCLQALPAVRSLAESLTIYMRSMTCCHPFRDFKYPKVYTLLYRLCLGYGHNTFLARQEESYFTTTVPDPDLHAKLRPTGRFGAKRPLESATFLVLVRRPNVFDIADDLSRVDATGIVSRCRRSYCSLDHSMDKTRQAQLCEIHRSFDFIIWGT